MRKQLRKILDFLGDAGTISQLPRWAYWLWFAGKGLVSVAAGYWAELSLGLRILTGLVAFATLTGIAHGLNWLRTDREERNAKRNLGGDERRAEIREAIHEARERIVRLAEQATPYALGALLGLWKDETVDLLSAVLSSRTDVTTFARSSRVSPNKPESAVSSGTTLQEIASRHARHLETLAEEVWRGNVPISRTFVLPDRPTEMTVQRLSYLIQKGQGVLQQFATDDHRKLENTSAAAFEWASEAYWLVKVFLGKNPGPLSVATFRGYALGFPLENESQEGQELTRRMIAKAHAVQDDMKQNLGWLTEIYAEVL